METKSMKAVATRWNRKVCFDKSAEAVKGLPVEARTEFWRTYWSTDTWVDMDEVEGWVALVARRVVNGTVKGKIS